MKFACVIFICLALACRVTALDYIWSASDFSDGMWTTADNWTPSGVPGIEDNVSFTQSNITSMSYQPVTVRNVRITQDVNLTFTSSLTITGTLRMADGVLLVMGDLVVNGTVDLSTGTITSTADATFASEVRWASGALQFYGSVADIDTLTITGIYGLVEGSFNIITALNILDSARYLQDSVITIQSSATLYISATTLARLAYIPLTNCQIINNGFLHGVFSMLDQSSGLASFGISSTATFTLQNQGDILLEGSGFLEVSVYTQRSGSLNLLSYSTQEVGLRTNPSIVSYILGGSISGNGFLDTEIYMSENTALYLSATNNITVSSINFAGNALLQITLFDVHTHGILLTGSFNRRSGIGGVLQIVFGNGPNALLSSVPASMLGVHAFSRSTRTVDIIDSPSTLHTGLAASARSVSAIKPSAFTPKRRGRSVEAVEAAEAVVPLVNNGSVANPSISPNRDVILKIGDLLLLISPLQFTNPLPTPSLLDIEVENNKFGLTPAGVQWASAAASAVVFYNVTDVDCPNDCSGSGSCVFISPSVIGRCVCGVSDSNLHSDCSEVSYAYLAWIIAPAILFLFLLIESVYCIAEHKSRKRIVLNPANYPNIRPEVSAFRVEHRNSGIKRSFFDVATLFLFTTEIEGAARSYDMISKIILTMSTVAIGVLSIVPFTGSNKALQQVFVGINAGLIFTLALIQLGWTSLKPRKIEFDVEVDDKKISLWAPFNKETLSWVLRALPLEMNRLYTPPFPYKEDEFVYVDRTLEPEMSIRNYFANYYRLPKVECTRNISTNPVVNAPSAPAMP